MLKEPPDALVIELLRTPAAGAFFFGILLDSGVLSRPARLSACPDESSCYREAFPRPSPWQARGLRRPEGLQGHSAQASLPVYYEKRSIRVLSRLCFSRQLQYKLETN